MTTGSRHSATPAHEADQAEILERPYDHPDVTTLLRAFYQEQHARYGFADPVDGPGEDYTPPWGVFIVAYLHDAPAGCAGYRRLDRPTPTVEIKKLYLTPAARGRGLGQVLLAWLEARAAAAGAHRAVLESGVRNTAALRLFTATGYQPIRGYVDGRDPAINRAFAKTLTPPDRCDAGQESRATGR